METSHRRTPNPEDVVRLLKLDEELKDVTINNFTSLNVFFPKSNMDCCKVNASIRIGLNFNVDLEFFFTQDVGDIIKLNISVQNPDLANEIRSYTNYLQRKKNINLTLSVLKKFAIQIGERQLILDMLKLHSPVDINHRTHSDGGVLVKCHVDGVKYFKSHWKIQFDCCTHKVMDQIDFTVTQRDAAFYKFVKKSMQDLISPNLLYPIKVNNWWTIIEAFKMQEEESVIEIIESDNWDQLDFILLQNHTVNNNGVTEQYEIVESDDDDCFIVKK